MSTSYMNYAEKLNLPMSPHSPSNPGTHSTPTTATHSSPPQSPYKAYSPCSPSSPPYSPQSPQPYAPFRDPALTNKKPNVQQYAPYVPPTPLYENPSVLLESNSNASYSSPVSTVHQWFATNSSSKSMSPRPDTQIYTPYISPTLLNNKIPTPLAIKSSAPHVSPVSVNDWSTGLLIHPPLVNNRSNMQSYASSASSATLYEKSSVHSTSSAIAPFDSSPLSANVTLDTASNQPYASHVPSKSVNTTSNPSYPAPDPVYRLSPVSTPSPPSIGYVPSTSVNEKYTPPPISPLEASRVSASLGKNESYSTHAASAPAYNQPTISYSAELPAHEAPISRAKPHQSPASYIPSALTSTPPDVQSESSAPFIKQSNILYLDSISIHDKTPLPSASLSSQSQVPPPPPPNNPRGSSHMASMQDQKTNLTSSTSLAGTQGGPLPLVSVQPKATSGIPVPVSNQSNSSYAAPIPVDNNTPLSPPPASAVPSPPEYKLHEGYFTSRPAIAEILTPPITKNDPPMNQTCEVAAQPAQGLAFSVFQFPSTPKSTPISGTAPTIPLYNPQCLNQVYRPVAPSPSLAFPPGGQYPYTPESTPTGASIPQFPLPPIAATATEGETKSSWGKRFVGDMLITRGIRAGVTSVASSVKLPAMLSPWGDNNPVTLPNVRRRDVVLLTGSHFGADAIVSGSLTFASGLLVNAMQCVSEQVVDQAILDRIRFDEAKILRTTSVKSLQVTIKHQLMGVDADLHFFGERSAPLSLLSCAKGWFCPYLYASGRTPSVPRSQNFAVAQCFGPFLNGKHDPYSNQDENHPTNSLFLPLQLTLLLHIKCFPKASPPWRSATQIPPILQSMDTTDSSSSLPASPPGARRPGRKRGSLGRQN